MLGRVDLSMVLGRTDAVDVRLPMSDYDSEHCFVISSFYGKLQMLCLSPHDNCFCAILKMSINNLPSG